MRDVLEAYLPPGSAIRKREVYQRENAPGCGG